MELNKEQAIDILEKFDFFQGQRAGRELWNDKPFDVQEQDIAKFSQDVASLKNYIKELTEENKKLKDDYDKNDAEWREIYADSQSKWEKAYEKLEVENQRLCQNNLVFAQGVEKVAANYYNLGCADTVRKMQSEINKTLSALCKGDVSEIHRMIDQITKEMLEGTNGI